MALTVSEDRRFTPQNNDRLHKPPPSDVPLLTPTGDPWPRPYIFEDGLRRIEPYHFTYNTYCKMRWRGRRLLEIFGSEFRDRPIHYYKDAIADGRVVINGKAVGADYIIKNGDLISHTLHRHEPPVTAQPIKVLNEDDDIIVIEKPAGVPVHPAGRYRFNSVVEIMRAERHYAFNPLPCNRLDRLTSGIMFIGKNPVAAEDISEKLRGRTVRKEYLARVKGRFLDGNKNGVVVCEEDVVTISPILGLNRVREGGKSAKTLFKRLAYFPGKERLHPNHGDHYGADQNPDAFVINTGEPIIASQNKGDEDADDLRHSVRPRPLPHIEDEGYSIVHCLPLTGRTHQIRVHLQYLGHPISNDPIYSNRQVFGPLLAKADSSDKHDAEIIARLSEMGKTQSFAAAMSGEFAHPFPSQSKSVELESTNSAPRSTAVDETKYPEEARGSSSVASPHNSAAADLVQAYDQLVSEYERSRGEKMTGEKCTECGTPLYTDPGPSELGIYLHAISYSDLLGKWSYESTMPDWALPPSDITHGRREQLEWPITFTRWDTSWSPGLLDFDRETVVPNGGKMRGHQ